MNSPFDATAHLVESATTHQRFFDDIEQSKVEMSALRLNGEKLEKIVKGIDKKLGQTRVAAISGAFLILGVFIDGNNEIIRSLLNFLKP